MDHTLVQRHLHASQCCRCCIKIDNACVISNEKNRCEVHQANSFPQLSISVLFHFQFPERMLDLHLSWTFDLQRKRSVKLAQSCRGSSRSSVLSTSEVILKTAFNCSDIIFETLTSNTNTSKFLDTMIETLFTSLEYEILSMKIHTKSLNDQIKCHDKLRTWEQSEPNRFCLSFTLSQSQGHWNRCTMVQVNLLISTAYQEFPTRMVYLYYISCLRYTIPVENPWIIMDLVGKIAPDVPF